MWQPIGGIVDGALEFDGINDWASTPFVLNPADGSFSVFTWLKGGAPAQVLISQQNGANWLMLDPADGTLMTELRGSHNRSRYVGPLASEATVTDDDWHRVGLVWDGSNRTLYVDDMPVAEDTQADLVSSTGGLYIGAGSKLEAGSFFSGLIDDVVIFNRAVTP